MTRKRVILILRIICYGRIANKFSPFHRAAVSRRTYANARGMIMDEQRLTRRVSVSYFVRQALSFEIKIASSRVRERYVVLERQIYLIKINKEIPFIPIQRDCICVNFYLIWLARLSILCEKCYYNYYSYSSYCSAPLSLKVQMK